MNSSNRDKNGDNDDDGDGAEHSHSEQRVQTKQVPREAFWRQILVLLPVYLNVYMMGCTSGWVPNAIYFFGKRDEVYATPSQAALIFSSSEMGRLLFALPAGLLVDRFGRRKIILVVAVFHFVSWTALSLSAEFVTLYAARFLLGVATAFVNATAMTCIGEIASPEIRAKLTGIYQQFQTFGAAFQIVVSVLFSSYFVLSYCTVIMSSFCFVFFYWSLETPDYLISISQYEKAMVNLKYIRSRYAESEIEIEFDKARKYIENETKRKRDVNWFEFLTSDKIRTPLITSFLINFFSMAVGLYVAFGYITSIVPDNEFVAKKYYPLVFFCISALTTLILPFYIEKFPRRVLFLSGTAIVSLCNVVLAFMCYCYSEYRSDTCKWVFTFVFVLVGVVNGGTVQPMVSVLKAEILPQSVKGLGGSICVIAQSSANIACIYVFNYVWQNFGLYYNFMIFAGNGLILFLLIYHRVPESRGKLLSDIQLEQNCKE